MSHHSGQGGLMSFRVEARLATAQNPPEHLWWAAELSDHCVCSLASVPEVFEEQDRM